MRKWIKRWWIRITKKRLPYTILKLEPDDVLIARIDAGHMYNVDTQGLATELKGVFPDNQIIVLADNVDFEVVKR